MNSRRYIWPAIYGLSILPFVYLWVVAITDMNAAGNDPASTCWIVEADGTFFTPVEAATLLSIWGYGAWLVVGLVAFFFARAAGRGHLVSWLAAAGGLGLILFATSFGATEMFNGPYLEIARTHCEWP